MAERIIVGISDFQLVQRPDKLITFALGSCVGIALYDRASGLSGMAHIMLPASNLIKHDHNLKKFADTAIPLMYQAMLAKGAHSYQMIAKIAGGAMLFGQTDTMKIGERNVQAVKQELRLLGLRLVAEDTGKNYGRTMELDSIDGKVTIKTALHGVQELL